MISGEDFLSYCVTAALALLSLSFLLTVLRVLRGPTLPDRILALDMLVAIAIGFIAVLGIKTGYAFHVDIAIALGLVGFLATVAFARFVLSRKAKDFDSPKGVKSRAKRGK
ncbi:cation:proton antiporter [Mesorhizobium sp. CGMCC 1.15528]|uniref:Cation:proton antiporter n=1 Tax=Mesorhizobium zhangyense TaxID=1776730 RepID=A0A7C9V509_9HYPH|nr:cation:proton antiporter [Mesorhizobium zhangyense]NGN40584.1 cation:proton antiporter [Mesorhizobium zhangyense]